MSPLLTASITEDEFSRGFMGRLRVLNDFKTSKKLILSLRGELKDFGEVPFQYPDAVILALAAKIPLVELIQNHSLLPLHRTVSAKDYEISHGDQSRFDLIERFGLRCWRRTAPQYCTECIREDISRKCFSYWHRSHQLPGIFWCFKHKIQLCRSLDGISAFENLPVQNSNSNFQFSNQEFECAYENPIVQKFAQIINSFQSLGKPMAGEHARYRISKRVKQKYLRYNPKGNQPTLTDYLENKVPIRWTSTLYPEIVKRQVGEFFYPIDRIVSGVVTDETYALALAALFDSAEEAMSYWNDNSYWLPPLRKSSI